MSTTSPQLCDIKTTAASSPGLYRHECRRCGESTINANRHYTVLCKKPGKTAARDRAADAAILQWEPMPGGASCCR